MEAGTRLGPYEIRKPLGAGGMGEVYVAQDTRLQREVAVKVLPAEFAADPERLARFEQEARAAAALNHPHIAAVFDVGHDQDTHYIVQELLQGETLRSLISRGGLDPTRSLELGLEMAEALEAAHRAGIVHRDLKPENVFVTEAGHAKVLDFGLAKLTEQGREMSGAQASMSPTMLGTQAGAIMGTAGYMAPEQAKGEEVDHRADLFAFGAVLYEMLSGQRAFAGENALQTLNLIAHEPHVPLRDVTHELPTLLPWIVEKCLQKSPARRYQHVSDLVVDLGQLDSADASFLAPSSGEFDTAPVPAWRRAAAWVLAAWAVVATVAWFAGSSGSGPAGAEPIVLEVPIPQQALTRNSGLAVSPDGRSVVYVARGVDGPSQLWLRRLDTAEPVPIPGTEAARYPFWSPGGQTIGYFGQDQMWRLDLPTGTIQPIAPAPNGRGATWSSEGVIVYAPDGTGPLFAVRPGGGEPRQVTELPRREDGQGQESHRFPYFLPDGRSFVYHEMTSRLLLRGSLDDPARTVLVEDAGAAHAVGEYLVFARGSTAANRGIVLAQRFDRDFRQAVGEPLAVLDDIAMNNPQGLSILSASFDGTLAFQHAESTVGRLTWLDRSGIEVGVIGEVGIHGAFMLSPDAERVAFLRADVSGRQVVWTLDAEAGRYTRLSSEHANALTFSPEGLSILRVDQFSGIYEHRVTGGTGSGELLWTAPASALPAEIDWSVEDAPVVFSLWDGTTDFDIWSLVPGESWSPEPAVVAPGDQTTPQLSPDGRWLAYETEESGRDEIHVVRYPELTEGRPVSVAGGNVPRWRRDSGELFYLDPEGTLMAVAVENDEFGLPQEMFSVAMAQRVFGVDSSADRFLFNVAPEGAEPKPVTVIVNWRTELDRLFAARER